MQENIAYYDIYDHSFWDVERQTGASRLGPTQAFFLMHWYQLHRARPISDPLFVFSGYTNDQKCPIVLHYNTAIAQPC